ncbi:hypothetical protein GGR56DRAFT_434769 [Xylariaceae sp. FL0804]|nr:hypothetical protein GGR56DRAFT_434769 [Xylariaceae sp. FL0804]
MRSCAGPEVIHLVLACPTEWLCVSQGLLLTVLDYHEVFSAATERRGSTRDPLHECRSAPSTSQREASNPHSLHAEAPAKEPICLLSVCWPCLSPGCRVDGRRKVETRTGRPASPVRPCPAQNEDLRIRSPSTPETPAPIEPLYLQLSAPQPGPCSPTAVLYISLPPPHPAYRHYLMSLDDVIP